MSAERLQPEQIVEELATKALGIRDLAFRETGTSIPLSIAMAKSLLTTGRDYLRESLSGIDDGGITQSIDWYFNKMDNNEDRQQFFYTGVGSGMVGSAIMAIHGDSYPENFYQFRIGTPIPPLEETQNYKEHEDDLKDKSPERLDIEIEVERLRDLLKTESIVNILIDSSKLPAPTLLHLRSLHPTLTTVFRNCVDLYDRAMRRVEEITKPKLIAADADWLNSLVSDF